MYQIGNMVKIVSVQLITKGNLVRKDLSKCLLLTRGKDFRPRYAVLSKHQLEIVEVVYHGGDKVGYIGYKPLHHDGTHFLIGHCNYPTFSNEPDAEYKWTVYTIKLSHDENVKPDINEFEDIQLIDKWILEGKYVNKYLKEIKDKFI